MVGFGTHIAHAQVGFGTSVEHVQVGFGTHIAHVQVGFGTPDEHPQVGFGTPVGADATRWPLPPHERRPAPPELVRAEEARVASSEDVT